MKRIGGLEKRPWQSNNMEGGDLKSLYEMIVLNYIFVLHLCLEFPIQKKLLTIIPMTAVPSLPSLDQ
jgi:hypothetical protein